MTENPSQDKPIQHKIGIIYPPPEVRNIVDKTASFVARNGPDFESRIRQNEISNPKFNFLTPTDPYHAYYQHKVRDFADGKAVESASLKVVAPSPARLVQDAQKIIQDAFVPKEPPPELEFVHDPASINALDIDIVKLTAQFVARNGKQFLAQLMNREQRNYQFDFLRSQHNMFGYFTKLVEQYTKVLVPPRDLIANLDNEMKTPKSVLDRVKYRVEWHKYQERLRKKEEEATEKERVAYAMIDWHDFVVVETVDFSINEAGSFPMPTTPEEVGARTIADERGDMLPQQTQGLNKPPPVPGTYDAIQMELQALDDENDLDEDNEDDRYEHVINETEIAFVPESVDEQTHKVPDEAEKTEIEVFGDDMDLSDGEDEPSPPPPQISKLPSKPRPAPPNADQVVIRHDYDPKAVQHKEEQPLMLISPFTNEKILASQAQKHMHVGLLDPKWIEQRDREIREKREQDQVYAPSNLIESNLKSLAQRRSDIFGVGSEETTIGKKIGEDESNAKPDKLIWDGHQISADSINKRTRDYITPADVQAQYEAEQKLEADRAKIGVQLPLSQAPPTLGVLPPSHMSMMTSNPTQTPMPPPPPPPSQSMLMMMGQMPPGMVMPPPLQSSMFPPGMMPPTFMSGGILPPPPQGLMLPPGVIPPPLPPHLTMGVPPQPDSDQPEPKRARTEQANA